MRCLIRLVLKGAFTLANFARDFALSLHVLLNNNYLFSLLNVQASAKSRVKSRQCKCTFTKYYCFPQNSLFIWLRKSE